jgi:hypothetical protein
MSPDTAKLAPLAAAADSGPQRAFAGRPTAPQTAQRTGPDGARPAGGVQGGDLQGPAGHGLLQAADQGPAAAGDEYVEPPLQGGAGLAGQQGGGGRGRGRWGRSVDARARSASSGCGRGGRRRASWRRPSLLGR